MVTTSWPIVMAQSTTKMVTTHNVVNMGSNGAVDTGGEAGVYLTPVLTVWMELAGSKRGVHRGTDGALDEALYSSTSFHKSSTLKFHAYGRDQVQQDHTRIPGMQSPYKFQVASFSTPHRVGSRAIYTNALPTVTG